MPLRPDHSPTVSLKLACFQVYNTVIASLTFLLDKYVRNFSRAWYPTGGLLIGATAFGDAIFIQVSPRADVSPL